MYYETEAKMRGRRDAITSLLTPADLQPTERSPDNMERGVENLRRIRACRI